MVPPCYCVKLRAATRKVGEVYDRALEPLGINVAQLSLLRRIRAAEPVNFTDLGKMVALERSTIGRNLRVLERIGLVLLGPGGDQRETVARLTEAGQEILNLAGPVWDECQKKVEDKIGEQGVETLDLILKSF